MGLKKKQKEYFAPDRRDIKGVREQNLKQSFKKIGTVHHVGLRLAYP